MIITEHSCANLFPSFLPRLLTWEDGYCDYPQPRDSAQHLSDNVCFNDTSRSLGFDHEINMHDGSSEGYSIGLAVANMSCLMYALGEGYVRVQIYCRLQFPDHS